MTSLEPLILDNGLRLEFSDQSNRYFGDYHRVLIEVSIAFDLPEDDDGSGYWEQARTLLGPKLTLNRTLERMAVASADVEQVRDQLVTDFLRHAGDYLSRPEYLRSQVDAELKKRRTGRRY